MTRFASLSHGVLLSLVLVLPLMRAAWDQWAQTAVHLIWSFLIVLGALLVLLGRTGDFQRFGSAIRKWGPLWAVFLGAGLLSALRSAFPHSALPSVLNDAPVFAFWGLAVGSSAHRRGLYARTLAGAGVLAVLSALLGGTGATVPWTGLLLNPNILASLVLLTGPLTLHLCLRSENEGPARWVWAVAFGGLCVGLVLSRSLVGYGTAAVQLVLAVVLFRRRRGMSFRRGALLLAAAGLLVGGGLFLARADWPKLFHGDADRWTWWWTALRVFSAHPWLGVGPGAFGEAYPAFRAAPWGLNSLYAHNFVLEFLAERGLLGAGALFLLMGTFLVRARRAVSGGAGLFLGLTGFCVYNLFHIGFSFPALLWLFFLAAGLAGAEEDPPAVSPSATRRRTLALLSAGLGILLAGASVALFRSDQYLGFARTAVQEERWGPARDLVDRGLRWNRWNPELFELRAALRLKSQDWEGASVDLARAVALAPASAGLRVESAELLLEGGDADRALREYETATRLLPLKASSWERRGDLLAGRGQKEEALRSYAGALRALGDPRVLAGDPTRRAAAARRVQEKEKRLNDVPKN
jgi:tetratricopeptide (TPR) repeat protein